MNQKNYLFELLALHKGEIVSTASLTSFDIEQARSSGRMYVDDSGLGFVWMPDIKRCPETMEEVELFEKWFPLPVPIPAVFDTLEKMMDNYKSRLIQKYFTKNELVALMHENASESLAKIADYIEEHRLNGTGAAGLLKELSEELKAQIIVVNLRDNL